MAGRKESYGNVAWLEMMQKRRGVKKVHHMCFDFKYWKYHYINV